MTDSETQWRSQPDGLAVASGVDRGRRGDGE